MSKVIKRHLYRRWPDSRGQLELTTLSGAVYSVPPGAWVNTDLLVGVSGDIRRAFETKALKAKFLPVSNPHEVDGLPVVVAGSSLPTVPGRHGGTGRAASVETRVALVVANELGADLAIQTAHLPFRAVFSCSQSELEIQVAEALELAGVDLVAIVPAGATTPAGWLRNAPTVNGQRRRVPRSQPYVFAAPGYVLADVTAIVLTVHGRADVALPCIRQLVDATDADYHLIVVDDCSDRHVSDRLMSELESVADRLPRPYIRIRLTQNRGYREAANLGAELGMKLGADHIVFLNSDMLVGQGWLGAMLRGVHTGGGSVVNVHCNDAALISLPLAGHKIRVPWSRLRGGRSYQEIAATLRFIRPEYPDAVTSVGNCMLVTRAAWAEFGPFKEIYGRGYGEECELWAQVIEGGGRCVVADDAYVFHESHATHGSEATEAEKRGVDLFRSRHELTWAAAAHKMSEWPTRTVRARAAVSACKPTGLPFHILAVDLGAYGGAYCLVRLVAELQKWGIWASVGHLHEQKLAVVPPFGTVRHRAETTLPDDFAGAAFERGVIVASHWSTGKLVGRIAEKNPGLVPMAFWQDREDLFIDPSIGQNSLGDARIRAYTGITHRVYNAPWVMDSAVADLGVIKTDTTRHIQVGIDTDLFWPAEKAPVVRVLAMWRPHTIRRGADRIRAVYAILKDLRPDIQLELFGWGDGVPAGVRNHGLLTQRQVADLMSEVSIVLEASDYQGFGLPGAEAMASGCALVTTDTKGVWAYATPEQVVLTSHNPADIARAIIELADDPERQRRLGAIGQRAIKQIDWRRIGARWVNYLADLWRRNGTDPSYQPSLDDASRRATIFLKGGQ